MKREPLVLLGLPLERHAVAQPGRFFIACALAFVATAYVVGALIDAAGI